MVRRVRIGADGNVIKDGDENGGAEGSGAGRRRCRLPSYVDVFGFHLEFKHFILLLVLVALTMGPVGGMCICFDALIVKFCVDCYSVAVVLLNLFRAKFSLANSSSRQCQFTT